ncbi:MAG: hypothetical protein WCG82_08585, partial [Bacteroidota bacterium]
PLSAKTKQTIRQPADGFVFRRTEQNTFCEGHEKNKIYREAGLLWLCKEPPQGITAGNPCTFIFPEFQLYLYYLKVR